MNNLKDYTIEQLVAKCAKYDAMIKDAQAELDQYKTELQDRGITEMAVLGKKQIDYTEGDTTVTITDAIVTNFINPEKLRSILGDEVFEKNAAKTVTVNSVIQP